jgi:hypothetical protein
MGIIDRIGARLQRKRGGALTLEEAIASGLIDPAALGRSHFPRAGVSVRYYATILDRSGRLRRIEPEVQVHYPSWSAWRDDLRSKYLGGRGILGYRDVPSGVREPILDLSAGATAEEISAARGFLIDQGVARIEGIDR